jgi:4-hydroxybenzoate polyprenyltransferase/phosphoserine phosphatase
MQLNPATAGPHNDAMAPPPPEVAATAERVVVVDLDGTLTLADTLHEQVIRLIFRAPLQAPLALLAALRGRAALKDYCATRVTFDPASLPYCEEVLAFLRNERARGSRIVLCTAAHRSIADAVARHLGLFDDVLATDGAVNLKGPAKAAALGRSYPGGFVYAGDHAADLDVWATSTGIVLAGASRRVGEGAAALGKPIIASLRPRDTLWSRLKTWSAALRTHQWTKNLLIFVPLLLSHNWTDWTVVLPTLLAFLLLLAVTSSTYLLNDLADLDADRQHPTKRHRPIASGKLPAGHAAIAAVAVLPAAIGLAALLDATFALGLAAYVAITVAYSFRLKRIPLLDTLVIGFLFTLRVAMGSSFVDSAAAPTWLLTFSMFFFTSLALAKRHAEIVGSRTGTTGGLAARGYRPDDWPLTLVAGTGLGIASLVILIIYLVNEAFRVVGYARPEFLWGIVLLVAIWLGRIWLVTHRGQLSDDPVSYALRDRPSQLIAAVTGLLFLAAL